MKTYLVSFYNENGDNGMWVRAESPEEAIKIAKDLHPDCFNFDAIELSVM